MKPKHPSHPSKHASTPLSEIPPAKLHALREFVEKVGGVENAREALETLRRLRTAA